MILKEWLRKKLSCFYIDLHNEFGICTYLYFLKMFSIDHIEPFFFFSILTHNMCDVTLGDLK